MRRHIYLPHVECGQRWWRWRSWVPYKHPRTGRDWSHFFRKTPGGFAIGPILFY